MEENKNTEKQILLLGMGNSKTAICKTCIYRRIQSTTSILGKLEENIMFPLK